MLAVHASLFTRSSSEPGPASLRKAYTLVEIVVVVAVIALLIGMLVPAIGNARERGRRVSCVSNLGQIGRAFLAYCSNNSDYLPSYPGYGHQMTALATCPDLPSHNWAIWTDPAWGSASVWDIVPLLPTTAEWWMDSQSSYHAIQRLVGGQWLAFLRGTSDSSPYPRLGFATSTDGRSWDYFPQNPVITPSGPGERGGVYRPNFCDL